MIRKSVHLIDDLAIVQGETYILLTNGQIRVEGDWVGGVPRGQIRKNILYEEGELLTVWLWEDSEYEASSNTTILKPWLSDHQTTLLPPTKLKSGRQPNINNSWVTDWEVEKDGKVAKVPTSFVQVIGEVTDNSLIYDAPIIWNGAINSIELSSQNLNLKTYSIWGDEAKTILLGSFEVADGISIQSITFDEITGTLTIELSDGSSITTTSLFGAPGPEGPPGSDGLSAYELAVLNGGFVGTEEEWRESLQIQWSSLNW